MQGLKALVLWKNLRFLVVDRKWDAGHREKGNTINPVNNCCCKVVNSMHILLRVPKIKGKEK